MSSASLPARRAAAASSRSRATASSPSSGASVSASHRRTDPAVVHRPAHDPQPGHEREAEEPALGIGDRPLDAEPQRAARADRARRDARPHRAHADIGQRPVGGPGDDRQPGREPGLARGRRGELQALGRGHELAEPLARDPGQGERLGVPVAAAAGRAARSPRRPTGRPRNRPVSRCRTSSLTPPPAPRPRDDVGGVRGEPARAWPAAPSGAAASPSDRGGRGACGAAPPPRPAARRSAQVSRPVSGPAVGAERAQAVHRGADRHADDPRRRCPARRRPPRAARSPRRRRPRRGRARRGRARARAA